jgi:hypothetical protein
MESDSSPAIKPIKWANVALRFAKTPNPSQQYQHLTSAEPVLLFKSGVGGQDNIQAVAGQMLGFFAELGFIFPQFPYIAHSRGWSHEDMERNVEIVRASRELVDGATMLTKRCLDLAGHLIARDQAPASIERGGRKAHAIQT